MMATRREQVRAFARMRKAHKQVSKAVRHLEASQADLSSDIELLSDGRRLEQRFELFFEGRISEAMGDMTHPAFMDETSLWLARADAALPRRGFFGRL